MLIDWFTVFAQLANFVILIWLLKRFLYRPVLDAMAAREKRVRETVAAAEHQQVAAVEETNRLREEQATLAREKEQILKAAHDEAVAAREELLAQARQEMEARKEQWGEALDREWQESRADLIRRVQDEALAIARQALHELADAEIEERMAEAFVKRLAKLDGEAKASLRASVLRSTRPLVLRSGFAIGQSVRERLKHALQEFAPHSDLHFEVDPALVAGVEVWFDGQKLAWTFDDFLRSIELSATKLSRAEG